MAITRLLFGLATVCLLFIGVGAARAESPESAGVQAPSTAEAQGLGVGCPGAPFASSYMATNRARPFAETRANVVPAPAGQLSFFTAPGAYQANQVKLRYRTTSAQSFITSLRNDLGLQVAARKSLAIYIHGLAYLFDSALTATAAFGCALAQPQQGFSIGYTGLVIGFSWPSYGPVESARFYASNPPNPPSGTICDNILGSRESFVSLMQMLADGLQGMPVDVSVLTHSEGNYMLMVGMAALAAANPSFKVRHCLMMAPDISAVSLQTAQQGQAIADICQDVAVYYSGTDPDMTVSNYEFVQFHVKDFPTRLGQIGPYYYANPTPLNANVTGLDSSKVTVDVPGGLAAVHSSYRSLPPVLLDLTQTMLGIPSTNRCPIAGTTQGFTLEAAVVTTCGP
jgi:esterase/lipase superfamily enzyme